MLSRLSILTLCVGGLLLPVNDAFGHGGSYKGPPGGVPPGIRPPSDPEPPPPPPSDPGDPDGPSTGGPDVPGPITPPPGGHETPPDSAPPPVPTPIGKGRPTRTSPSLTYESWRFWWGYNNAAIFNVKSHIYAESLTVANPIYHATPDSKNRRNAQRPTRRAIEKILIPALLRTINRKGDHEDIHGGALVALGKVGLGRHLGTFEAAIWNRYRNDRGQKIDFGYQATESGALAIGLMPDLDPTTKAVAREICLRAIADDTLRTRERAWAAVSLGLQRDSGALEPLMKAFRQDYADDNVPAGILAGIGLIGDSAAVPMLQEIFLRGRHNGNRVSSRVQAFAGYALGKIGDASALPTAMRVLNLRRAGRLVRRSAAIAVGVLGQSAGDKEKDAAVQALLRFMRKSGGDLSGEAFAAIALSQIGTERALLTLLDVAKSGRYSLRPFAALGLGTHVWYRTQRGDKMDPSLRARIGSTLVKLSEKHKDNDTKAAFLLARGLCKDVTAIPTLVGIASKRSADPVLRAFACEALGLVGRANRDVKDALRNALSDRRSVVVRRSAATGLSLLRDTTVLPLLLKELKRAKSFTVQAQLIQAIGTVGDQSAIDPLVKLLDDRSEPAQTRAMAAVGLGMVGDLNELPRLARLSQNYNYRCAVRDIDELLYIL